MLKCRPLTFGLLCAATLATAAHARPGTLLSITNEGPDSRLVEIEPETGEAYQLELVGAPGVSMAFNRRDGQIYAILMIREPPAPTRVQLATVDRSTGTLTPVGDIVDSYTGKRHEVVASGFLSDGTLYGVSRNNRRLVEIDTSTALATPIGDGLGVPVLNAGGAVVDDVFYFLNGTIEESDLYWVDTTSGVAHHIGTTGVAGSGVGLADDGAGGLYASLYDTIYAIDPATAEATWVTTTEFPTMSSLTYLDHLDHLCPCDGPWRNHGQYVSCVAHAAQTLPGPERGKVVSEAGRSTCGK